MSTNAMLAYKDSGDKIVCKYVHHGLYADVCDKFYETTYDEVVKSVNKGDSSNLFDGFYSNRDHTKKLGWTQEMHDYNLERVKPYACNSLDELFEHAKESYCMYIYLVDWQNNRTVYSKESNEYLSLAQIIDELEPIETRSHAETALNELESVVGEFCVWPGSESRNKVQKILHENGANEWVFDDGIDDVKEFVIAYNCALPEIKKYLKGLI